MVLSLYDITSGFPALIDKQQRGEITEEEAEFLKQELNDMVIKKSSNIIGYLRNEELTIEAMKAEKKRLDEAIKTLEKKRDSFKDYIKRCMNQNDTKKIVTSLGILSLDKNPMSAEVIDEDKVPNKYKKITTTTKVSIDLNKIKADFTETGEIIPGIKIINNKESLHIK